MARAPAGRTRFNAAVAVYAVALAAVPVPADVIYVDDSATAGANNGESWRDAFTDLQSALAIAKAGDEIRVAQGTYKPAPPGGDRTISFNLVSGTILQGGYAGFGASDPDANDPKRFITTLSGDIDEPPPQYPTYCGEDSFHVVYGDHLAVGTELRGVVVRSGCAFGDDEQWYGGGLHLRGESHMVIADSWFLNNWAYYGAGVYVSHASRAQFERCQFRENQLPTPGSFAGAGALCNGQVAFLECTFRNNSAAHDAGGVLGSQVVLHSCLFVDNGAENGGAVGGASAAINCVFLSNGATQGGAVRQVDVLLNCTFIGNHAGEYGGGAVAYSDRIINCLFVGNGAYSSKGGAVRVSGAAEIRNCTFVGNESVGPPYSGGGAIYAQSGHAVITNCITWRNSVDEVVNEGTQILLENATMNVQNSCVDGWTSTLGGVGNHGNDPRFVDADGTDDIYGTADDDPRLRPNSPCIDSGDATLLPPDEFDLDDDGDVTEPLPVDLDFVPRVVGANLDMGAFEFQGVPCRADITGDASVGIDDLLAVISGWGPCVPGEECNADLNLDSAVTLLDLQRIIDDWGACP
jgi:hypothetical protein